MINRLPLEFRLPGNGRKSSEEYSEPASDGSLVSSVSRRSARYIADYPVVALGAAFVTGLILARLVKR
jgi:hypothetical protein